MTAHLHTRPRTLEPWSILTSSKPVHWFGPEGLIFFFYNKMDRKRSKKCQDFQKIPNGICVALVVCLPSVMPLKCLLRVIGNRGFCPPGQYDNELVRRRRALPLANRAAGGGNNMGACASVAVFSPLDSRLRYQCFPRKIITSDLLASHAKCR